MKRLFHLALIATFSLLAAGQLTAQTVGMSPFGYGRSATGGGNATPTLVSNKTQLVNALKGTSSRVVIITQNITTTSMISIQSAQNLTLMALPGVSLTNLQQDASNSGILYFKSCSNIIIRNITFIGPGAYDCDGNDLLCFDGVTNAWVDHCDFQDGCDGNYDNKGKTDNVTVSWCRFRYLKAPKAGGPGGSDDHRYSNLLGSSSSDKPSDGTYNLTWAYCWWDSGCRERMVRGRNASLHFLNCYWSSSVANYYIGPENMDAYVEGCYFGGKATLAKTFNQNYGGTNGAMFVNSYSNKGTLTNVTNRAVQTPTYPYTALSYNDAKDAVSDATCGAGATLVVTNTGSISSGCDNGGTTDPTPNPPTNPGTLAQPSAAQTSSTFWNFSDSEFANLGTINTNTEVRHLFIGADVTNTVVIEANSKTVDNISFTSRLKTGGGMLTEGRYLAFGVTGPCTIELYAISSSSSATRTLNICGNTLTNILHSEAVAGDAVRKFTYSYSGPATTIYIGSESGGMNFYGIRLTYDNTATAIDQVQANKACKYMLNGAIYIEKNGILYDVIGRPVSKETIGL